MIASLFKRAFSFLEYKLKSYFNQRNNANYQIDKPIVNGVPPSRYPENSRGDFYVENQVCTSCMAPQAEAPDLIDHSKTDCGHCYFKKQPQTPDELDRAIIAMQVSCISGLRYGGKDVAILKRLFDQGLENECDYKLPARRLFVR